MTNDHSALQDLVLFVEVARTRNFSQSAKNLGLSAATLSRRIHALELHAGVRLFNRTTRRVELTTLGEQFLERCGHLVDDAKLVRSDLANQSQLPTGHLRITTPVDLGRSVVGPMLPAFARRFPGITFSLDLSSDQRDLLSGEADIALRLIESKDKSLVTRRIGWLAQALYASPTYLGLKGRPSVPGDLVQHDCIVIGGARRTAEWTFQHEKTSCKVSVQGRFSVNNQALISALAENDLGIAMLEPVLCRKAINAGRLLPVLEEWVSPPLPVYVVTTSKLQSAAARAFIEFVTHRFATL
jgi:DNA-binding transcriptional LysR family regulator